MSTYAQYLDEDRRLTILTLLAEAAGYQANQYLLQSALDGFGHVVSQDRLRSDLSWLAEQGLLTVSATAGVQIAQLSARGLDVAQGRAVHPGVKRPRPA